MSSKHSTLARAAELARRIDNNLAMLATACKSLALAQDELRALADAEMPAAPLLILQPNRPGSVERRRQIMLDTFPRTRGAHLGKMRDARGQFLNSGELIGEAKHE